VQFNAANVWIDVVMDFCHQSLANGSTTTAYTSNYVELLFSLEFAS